MSIRKPSKNKQFKNKLEVFVSNLKEVGLEIEDIFNIDKNVKCIQLKICKIYYTYDEIRVSFNIQCLPEQVALITSYIYDIFDKPKFSVSKCYYQDETGSILVGDDAYNKYFEDITDQVEMEIESKKYLKEFEPRIIQ